MCFFFVFLDNEEKERDNDSDREMYEKANENNSLYDRVLVDAQCTHDGSVKHIIKYRDLWGWDALKEQFL